MKKFIIFLFFASSSVMAHIDCKGKVTRLGLHIDSGILFLGLEGGPGATQLCSVSKIYNNIPVDSCKVLYSTLLASKASGKKSLVRFYDHDSCNSAEMNWKAAGTLGWSDHLLD